MAEGLSDEARLRILERIPMGRFGSPEDVAEAVTFLCGEGAGYITGQVLTIDGGMIA
jgi:3-oxoacyl-[acyl-carrier protein] reductase